MKNLALLVVFAAVTGLIVFYFMGGFTDRFNAAKDRLDSHVKTEEDFVKKLEEYKIARDQLKLQIKRFDKQKQENIQYLKDKGISKVADAGDDPDAKMALINLKGWNDSIKKLQGQVGYYDSAISKLEAVLTKLARERENERVGLSDQELEDLFTIQKELDDQLGFDEDDILQDLEFEQMINEENDVIDEILNSGNN